MATRMGLEPTISALTGRYVNHLHHRAVCVTVTYIVFRSRGPGQLASYLGNSTLFQRRSFNAAMIG